jgi:hypothetical protein
MGLGEVSSREKDQGANLILVLFDWVVRNEDSSTDYQLLPSRLPSTEDLPIFASLTQTSPLFIMVTMEGFCMIFVRNSCHLLFVVMSGKVFTLLMRRTLDRSCS